MSHVLTAIIVEPNSLMEVKLLHPVRDTQDWTVADPNGVVIVVPRSALRLQNWMEVTMRLESERSACCSRYKRRRTHRLRSAWRVQSRTS